MTLSPHSFEILKQDNTCRGRTGLFSIGNHKIPTPILWLGHSLKSKVRVSDYHEYSNKPIIVSMGDLIGRNRLHEKVANEGIHDYLAHSGPIIVDSGGFKFMSQKTISLSVEETLEFYERSGADIGVTLDHPMSLLVSKDTNKKRWSQTLENFRKANQVLKKTPIIPVLHGLSLSQLHNSCEEIRSIIKNPVILGLGSLVPLLKSSHIGGTFRYRTSDGRLGNQVSFIADAIELVKTFFPSSLLHIFGVGSPTSILAFYALGADSVDSVAWRIKAAYGAVFLPGSSERYLTERPYSNRNRKTINKRDKEILYNCQCPFCRTAKTFESQVHTLDNSFRARAIHNAWVVKQEVLSFRQALNGNTGKKYIMDSLRPQHRMYQVVVSRF